MAPIQQQSVQVRSNTILDRENPNIQMIPYDQELGDSGKREHGEVRIKNKKGQKTKL